MKYKILKTTEEHQAALREAEVLIALDPRSDSLDGERLALLALLIEDYEKRSFRFEALDPVDVIEYKMTELGLRQRDLVPLLGSRSRVSEVLARKRPLTVQMIRALSSGLGISTEALVGAEASSEQASNSDETGIEWSKFPYKEMEKRGWFGANKVVGDTTEERLRSFLSQVMPAKSSAALFRRKYVGTKLSEKATYATLAWSARVLLRASEQEATLPKFDPSRLNPETLRDLARLSWFNDGPRLAVEYLAKFGVAVVVEPRLSNAVFDGAAMLSERGVPVIGLTLRIDRVDYFWFTLMHEVAHVWKHLSDSNLSFVDRIDSMSMDEQERMELEANKIAKDSFVRRVVWERSAARLTPTTKNIQELADELHIHAGIIAGRIQFETGKYELFREFLGQGSVLDQFKLP